MRASKAWVYLIAGWSGFFVMLFELIGGRLISPFFGSSVYVWGSVIFVFMFALSIGYLAGGRYSRRAPSLRRLCGILVVAALTVLPTVFAGETVLDRIFAIDIDPRYGSLAACLVLFAVPTFFSGMVSPYAVRLVADRSEAVGADAGTLYFVSTLGSSAGTLLTAFYFVLWFEVDTILLAAIAVSLALAAAAAIANRT